MSDSLVVNEVYLSLQGESTLAGLPCIFVRLTACDLRCSYCDTAYAFTEGKKWRVSEVLRHVRELAGPFSAEPSGAHGSGNEAPSPSVRSLAEACAAAPRLPLVELTGGEPLLQPNSLPLMKQLCDEGFTVLIETSGAHDIAPIDWRVRRIMDLKCPSSGEVTRNRWENLPHLKSTDEVKFVIGTVEDYQWAREQICQRRLAAVCPLLCSWVSPLTPAQQAKSLQPVPPGQTPLSRRELAERILADALPVRFQVQMHKVIWPPDQRGV
ncbi:MAG TPA: radical SAM protein [Candidatus Binatia bacterium]|nr:radical SAM protein [Candidatus Binatia bacterium]